MWDKDLKKKIGEQALRPETLMMGYGYRPEWSEGALKPPIFQTSTFVFETAEEGKAFFELAYGLREKGRDEELGLIYSRLNNPILEILEDRLTVWDGAEAAAVFESGMAAIATTLLTFLRPGDVIAFSQPAYGGTEHLLRKMLPAFGIEPVPFPAAGGREALEARLDRAGARERLAMIYVETPANPTNALVDIGHLVALAREVGDARGDDGQGGDGRGGDGQGDGKRGDRQGVLVAVDNTFLGPLWQHPLELGADLVLYSLTKYVGGHSDLIAGACLGSAELLARVRATRTFLGTMAGPWTAWLLLRSLETLKLRMTSQMKNARYVADFLADHPKVERVHYPGRLAEGDPSFEVYRRQCLAPGAMISFEVRGGEPEAFRLLNALQLVKLAVSLGGTESLAEHPGTMTHSDVSLEDQLEMGITPGMVRLSVGVEHPEDLIADLEQALAEV